MARQSDLKRSLAYSSVEHVGILALGLGIGGGALFGCLLHLLNNSISKGVLFLTSGNIHRSYNNKSTHQVRGVLHRLPWTGAIFLAGFLAITGTPPFSPFISMFSIVNGAFSSGHQLVGALMLVFLAAIFIGFASTIIPVVAGRERNGSEVTRYRDSPTTVGPSLVLVLLLLMLGLWIPPPLGDLLREGARLLEVRQ
jgi:hydrogenase-4 component F